jgi:hypothetical protein
VNLEDIREQTKEALKTSWDKIQESSVFIQSKEKFENLNPNMQSLVIAGGIALVLGGLLILPLDTLSSSNQALEEFETKRALTRELMRATRDAELVPNIPVAPTVESIVDHINSDAKKAQLFPEQILSVTPTSADSKIIPTNLTSAAVTVRLAKLNLRQVLDMSYRLTQIGLSVKMTSLSILANSELPGYFDLTAKVIALKVPQMDRTSFEDKETDKADFKKKPLPKLNNKKSDSKSTSTEDSE